MPNQTRNCPEQVHREKLGIELEKMPFYGQPGNCVGAYYFIKRDRN